MTLRGLLLFLALIGLSGTPFASSPRDDLMRARGLIEAGDLSGALTVMEQARQAVEGSDALDRELADALAGQLFNLGVRFNNGGRPLDAMRSLTGALRLDARARGVRDPAFRASLRDASLQVARYLIASGKPAAALEACGILSARTPPDAAALSALGAARLALGDDGAVAAWEAAFDADPTMADAAAGAGEAWLARASRAWQARDIGSARSSSATAVDWLRRAVSLGPASPAAHRTLSAALMRLSEAQARLGEAAASRAHAGEAENALRRGAEIDTASPWIRQDLAMWLFGAARYEEAAAEFSRLRKRFEDLLRAQPEAAEAAAWRQGEQTARDNESACLHNLVVDALNRARFDRARELLAPLCAAGDRWRSSCDALRKAVARREELFRGEVGRLEQELAREPTRASALLALGDLYAQVGEYDRALGLYRQVESTDRGLQGLADRIASVTDPGPLPELVLEAKPPGGRIRLRIFNPALAGDLDQAARAAWLRVTTALGDRALGGELEVIVYPTRRVFRERAGSRIGGLVKGFYDRGRVSLFETPSHTTVEWVSALTHEMAHHAVESLSGGTAPRWLSEGISRYVEGDAALVDRVRMARRLASVPPLEELSEAMRQSWNDPEGFLDARDAALLAVEEMARRIGAGRIGGALGRMAAGAQPLAELESALGISVAGLDAAWRAALPPL